MCVFCGTICVSSSKCVSIIIKIKCVNFGKMSDIRSKLSFIINYTQFTTTDKIFIKTQTLLTVFDTHSRTVVGP